MDEAKRREVAREILIGAVDWWAERQIRTGEELWQFSLTDDGGARITYAGKHAEGFGEFTCHYNPLPAVEKLLVRFEEHVAALSFDAPLKVGGGFAKVPLKDVIQQDQIEAVALAAARSATIILIGVFGLKLARILPEAVGDAALVFEAGLQDTIIKTYEDENLPTLSYDLRPELKRLAHEAGVERRREVVKFMRWARVIVEGKQGRPPIVTWAEIVKTIKSRDTRPSIATVARVLGVSRETVERRYKEAGYEEWQDLLSAVWNAAKM